MYVRLVVYCIYFYMKEIMKNNGLIKLIKLKFLITIIS